jgi:Protein of unknown function (DUF3800)
MVLLPSFRFVYQDESGDIKQGRNFIVGLLRVRQREPLWTAIREVRDKEKFHNEMHFAKMSPFRERAYIEVFKSVARVRQDFAFCAIVVRNDLLTNLRPFSGQRHVGYNFFTKLLLMYRHVGINDAIVYTDTKSRIKEDNFYEYLQTDVNLRHGRNVVKKVESLDSKLDDLMQLADLLVGCANNYAGGAAVCGDRKTRVRKAAEDIGVFRPSDLWFWRPRKKE